MYCTSAASAKSSANLTQASATLKSADIDFRHRPLSTVLRLVTENDSLPHKLIENYQKR